jgi:opacity protein-like surface antigen
VHCDPTRTIRHWRLSLSLLALVAAAAPTALAQTPPATAPVAFEEIEPRIVGRAGTTSIGLAGFVDKFSSSEEIFPSNYTAQVDVCRFVTRRLAVRVGVVGSGSFGGDESDELLPGSGAPSFQASGGLLFYFTPQKIASVYLGGEYWAQITRRAEGDTGSLLAVGGLQAAISSRASVFIQGGVGARMARGDDDELLTRIVAQLGVRIKL